MKRPTRFLLILSILSSAWLLGPAQAAVLWTEDFSGYDDGDDPNGNATATGSGTWNNNGTVAVSDPGNAGNEVLILTADGGRDTVQVDSSVGATCGRLAFDLAFLGDMVVPVDGNPTDIFFFQMTEGGRSTGANPIPGFSDTVDAGQHSISTDPAAPSSVEYFFNSTGAPITYTAPDGSMKTLPTDAYDYWVDGNLLNADQMNYPNTPNAGSGPPSSVSTILANTFNGQEGEVWQWDNFVFEDDIAAHVPEPSAFALLGVALAGFAFIRRRR